ncbi:Hypothetical predicted protein [Paramuricea clavata]|uniref:Uncharacterized protein n=1 Tax=Paramuricea clavata TaxID=317549 RepID=A0A7D9JKQ1_PARCT|nr:Hypothetical predicted protein [Paramuricea clavata]
MLPVVFRTVGFALGSVLNKVLNVDKRNAADKNWRDAIVKSLNNNGAKIDRLSQKDLRASYRFLNEGVDLLLMTIAPDEAKGEQTSKVEANGLQNIESSTTTTATLATSTIATTRNESKSGILNEVIALTHAFRELENTSNDRLVLAKERFTKALEYATLAFSDEALKLPDRIMAAKLRVVSKILECLQDTKAAASGCMLFLKELNHLPGIGETFSTYFGFTWKSIFLKTAQLENVKWVLCLNFVVSEFVATFSDELPNVQNWPRIYLSTGGHTMHPLLLNIEVVENIFPNVEFQLPENHVTSAKKDLQLCRINSKGELVALSKCEDHHGFILKRSGELKTFCDLTNQPLKIDALAVDNYDNIYVLAHFPFRPFPLKGDTTNVKTYVLLVFDSSGTKKCEKVLDFIQDESDYTTVNCVVNKDGDVLIHFCWKDYLYVCDSNGNKKSRLSLEHHSTSQFERDNLTSFECVTDHNEIIMVSRKTSTNNSVFVYTREGELKRTINLKYWVNAVTYNYATSKIEILVIQEPLFGTMTSYCIRSYSETGDVECLHLPETRSIWDSTIVSHPAGPAAFVYDVDDGLGLRVIFM